MAKSIFHSLLANLKEAGRNLPEFRREGHNLKHRILDAVLSAFAVFFFQHPSVLDFARAMQIKSKRDNVQSLFGAFSIPSDPQIRTILDGIEPEKMNPVFYDNVKMAYDTGLLDPYKVLGGRILIALDGVWYFSSYNVHCGRCLTITKDGKTLYYHSVLAGTIVRPGSNDVIPVMPEMINNGDLETKNESKKQSYEKQKQDCENKAAKRWIDRHLESLKYLNPVIVGDDLFSKYPVCVKIRDAGCDFIFTCKPDSLKWLMEDFALYEKEHEVSVKARRQIIPAGEKHLVHRYKWVNGVDVREEEPTAKVNFLCMETEDADSGEITYKNSWATKIHLDDKNVEEIACCARARWKIENEHNGVLKNCGYNLEHNFGHGKKHASEMFCLLNLLSLMFHTFLNLTDENYKKAFEKAGRRDALFQDMRVAFKYFIFDDWDHFIAHVADPGPPIRPPRK
jgi:hypothetical protein